MLNAAKGCVPLDASRLIVFTTMAVVQMVLRSIIDRRWSLHHLRRKAGKFVDQHCKQVRAFCSVIMATIATVHVEALNERPESAPQLIGCRSECACCIALGWDHQSFLTLPRLLYVLCMSLRYCVLLMCC